MAWLRSDPHGDIDDATIDEIIDRNVAVVAHLPDDDRPRLRETTNRLIASKRWEAVGDIDLTPEVLVTVAANAALPVLGLDGDVYRNVQSIIVRATTNVTKGRRSGPVQGVVSDDPLHVIGLATPNSGPLSIAWGAVLAESRRPQSGRNVVIHEFAHKIDMSDGYSDGTPPLGAVALAHWADILADEFERSDARESDAVFRPYAWSSPAEFFAVATEAFFCTPVALESAKPALYRALVDFYRQTPATWGPTSNPPDL